MAQLPNPAQVRHITFYSKSADPSARYLSNFHVLSTPLELMEQSDMRKFASIEHAYQAYKYLSATPATMGRAQFCKFAIGGAYGDFEPLKVKALGSHKGMKEKGCKLNIAEFEKTSAALMARIVTARCRVDPQYDEQLQHCAKYGIALAHFDRAGARSLWGGHHSVSTGQWMGRNLLGRILSNVGRARAGLPEAPPPDVPTLNNTSSSPRKRNRNHQREDDSRHVRQKTNSSVCETCKKDAIGWEPIRHDAVVGAATATVWFHTNNEADAYAKTWKLPAGSDCVAAWRTALDSVRKVYPLSAACCPRAFYDALTTGSNNTSALCSDIAASIDSIRIKPIGV